LLHGENGQGKSNLLESIYILSVGKSARASSDRELINNTLPLAEYGRISALVNTNNESLKLQIDYLTSNHVQPNIDTHQSYTKNIRINGVHKKSSNLIGRFVAVMFSAQDLDIIYGPPSIRRRYIDILISQFDSHYLTTLQQYQKILSQRNHLLKRLRNKAANADELDIWDERLIRESRHVMRRRAQTIEKLSELSSPIHMELSGRDEELSLVYKPSASIDSQSSEESFCRDMDTVIKSLRNKEIFQGITLCGPHRDDVEILIDGVNASAFGSRGQSRTGILSMKLAQASHFKKIRNQEPVILLDDILSELDIRRRNQILSKAEQFEQCFVTTADIDSMDTNYVERSTPLRVHSGRISIYPG